MSDIAKKGKTGDEKIYFDFTMFAFSTVLSAQLFFHLPSLLVFSVSFFSYLQIHVAYHTADFYFLFGKREREEKEIWESRVKTSFDVDALKIGSLINIGK